MRFPLFALAPVALLGCAAAAQPDAELACRSQSHVPGTEEFRICVDAGGTAISTGPGSPYAADRRIED